MLYPIIMAGGSGSRLWPLSRTQYPKQFLKLTSNITMLQETIKRCEGLDHVDPIVICNDEHRFIVAEQLRQEGLKSSGIILEPIGRNTAPAIALAAIKAIENGEDPTLLVLPADHVMNDISAFQSTIELAMLEAHTGKLITFGIEPTYPETGYGYIKKGDPTSDSAFKVESFVEKPNIELAQQYLKSGDYCWNSGMFLFKASAYLKELKTHAPKIFSSCQRALNHSKLDLDFIRVEEEAFSNCPDDSIDYAVMEKTLDAIVIPMKANWSDVGSWSALWDISLKDNSGNAVRGDVLLENTQNCYLYSQNKLLSTIGVKDLVVVETKDAVLVSHINEVQHVKKIVQRLKASKRNEHLKHRETYQPWGSHDEVSFGDRFQVKHILVKPGEKTSVQMHHHRSEHWVVVKGTAKVFNGGDTYLLTENQSTYIPIGNAHAIENPGKIPLELIEVRTGSYLSEEDVIRLEEYGES